jgi:signal transduction histidine kinase
MSVKNFRLALKHPTSWVFLFVLAAGLVMAFARADPPLNRAETAGILLLSAIYLFLGTVVFIGVLQSGSPGSKILYLVIQICLGMVILYLSRGNGWLLMLPLASHSVALFSPREAVLPCIVIALGIAWNTSQTLSNWVPFLQSAIVFGSAVFFAAVFTDISIRDARRREEIERLAAQLAEANRALRDYTAKAEEMAALQERNRLAREIHDGLGHYLTAMNLQANLATALIEVDPERARQALVRLQAMLLEALADVRRSVAALRSEPVLGVDLLAALEVLVKESCSAGLAVEFAVNGEARSLPAASELTLYRAVQEGLTNVRKHAQASQVNVQLDYLPQRVGLSIRDNGAGSALGMGDLDLLKSSFGLFGLRERVRLLGGEMHIQTNPGNGFLLEINLPVETE